ncbi:putative steroid-binding protein 3 [Zancudomyces culisetae]|uniref:Putative steroid-binding protein 3 n=1 Tax=Zancudomyces culisetae TaxID=1213189 RepID=A0A1R1PBU5_ZANCU|nr:putative steroid-binding protein 3 [Zancudomyces culisetae]|eukprot:OMH78438.1 putative steroid-binding protein 3 [Zancudomyces culisetae]
MYSEPGKTFDLESLSRYDGNNPSGLIYIAIKGKVYDVSHRTQYYGRGGSYEILAGKDATVNLAKFTKDPEHIPRPGDSIYDLSSFTENEWKELNKWIAFFDDRYQVVGSLVY